MTSPDLSEANPYPAQDRGHDRASEPAPAAGQGAGRKADDGVDHGADDHGAVTALLKTTLNDLANRAGTPSAEGQTASSTLGDLVDALDERAFGLMLLILALPCCIPFLWGIPQIVALPMLALAAQLAMGRHEPWLPEKFRARPFDVGGMHKVVDRAARYLGWIEKLTAPRLTSLTRGMGARVVGAIMLIPTASILVPLPSTNTAPGIGVAIAAIGLLERDGLMVLAGLIIGLLWVAALVTLFAMFGVEGIEIAKTAIKGLLGLE